MVPFTRTHLIVALALVALVAIVLSAALPFWQAEATGSRKQIAQGQQGCFIFPGRKMQMVRASTYSPSFLRPNRSTSFEAYLQVKGSCRGAKTRIEPAGYPTCFLFAPDFTVIQYQSDDYTGKYRCSWVIAPKHEGRGYLVSKFTMSNDVSFVAFREIDVADSPFTLRNITGFIGVFSGLAALYTAIVSRPGNGQRESRFRYVAERLRRPR